MSRKFTHFYKTGMPAIAGGRTREAQAGIFPSAAQKQGFLPVFAMEGVWRQVGGRVKGFFGGLEFPCGASECIIFNQFHTFHTKG